MGERLVLLDTEDGHHVLYLLLHIYVAHQDEEEEDGGGLGGGLSVVFGGQKVLEAVGHQRGELE